MGYKELIGRLNTGKFDRDYECTPFECGAFSLTREAATAITDLLSRAEAAEADRDRLREALKPNCLRCNSMHPDNGNCTEVGGFCTAVPAAHCPLLPRLMEENDHLKDLLKEAERRAEKAKRERDAAVGELRQMCVGGNTCAFCRHGRNCGKQGPGRKTVEPCWEWRGEKEE